MRAEKVCPQCGAARSKRALYCIQCGLRLEPDRTPRFIVATESAERRQVTVLFCDLVDSTPIAEQLDPEDLRDLLVAYRRICRKVVRRIGGRITRCVGDGILILFGFPNAYEQDAVSAVRVALGILSGMTELNAIFRKKLDRDLAVHIGVHTGIVVVGLMGEGEIRERRAVVGEAPNIAARLEQLAPPNSVFISETTYQLLNNSFECQLIGTIALKGISRPIGVLQVLAEQRVMAHASFPGPSKLLGRAKELARLRRLWKGVTLGRGHAVLVAGDPGIGKSALVRGLVNAAVRAGSCTVHVCRCSRQDTNSTLLPVIDLLRRNLPPLQTDRSEAIPTFEKHLISLGLAPVSVALLAFLLSIECRLADIWSTSPQVRRVLTKKALVDWFVLHSANKPIILVIEDLQWADSSTLEFLDFLGSNIKTARIFLVLTTRPEIDGTFDPSKITNISLGPLSAQNVKRIIKTLDGQRRLTLSNIEHIIAKTDGVPLFVEECTRMTVDTDQSLRAVKRSDELDIPASLRELLVARLDRQGAGKSLAKLASVLGRQFKFSILKALTYKTTRELQSQLDALVEGGYLLRIGGPSDGIYSFRHALIHEVAYYSLLRAHRRIFHARVATVLDQQFPEIAENQPELLAHHFTLAEKFVEAIGLWQKAGDRSLARSANVEAVVHYSSGLNVFALVPETIKVNRDDVALRVGLGTALIAVKGYGAPEVERAFSGAATSCRKIDDDPRLFSALRGLQSYYQVRGPLDTALEIGRQLMQMANRSGKAQLLVDANRRLAWCLFCLGNLTEARIYLDRAAEGHDGLAKSDPLFNGADPTLLWLVNSSWIEWFSGNSTVASTNSNRAVELAIELGHAINLTYSLCMAAGVSQLSQDASAAQVFSSKASVVASENHLPYWSALSKILLGWSEAKLGEVEVGARRIREGIETYKGTGARLFLPYSLRLLAETEQMLGRSDVALSAVEDALAVSKAIHAHFFDAEIYRGKGDLLRARGQSDAAYEAFTRATAVAEGQGAVALALQVRYSL
jgi:class 3 adenylate cyclase/predicted ATPase